MSTYPSLPPTPQPVTPSSLDDLAHVHEQLAALHFSSENASLHTAAIDSLFARTVAAATTIRAMLAETFLPHRKLTRQTTRTLQAVLRTLAEYMLSALAQSGNAAPPAQTLWQIVRCLALHLLISDLAAAPSDTGVWHLLHKAFNLARQHNATSHIPHGSTASLENIYYAALLLGCSQPSAFTAREINFIAAYLERFSGLIETSTFHDSNNLAGFWVATNTDAPATACIRKKAPQNTEILYFSCKRITAFLEKQLVALKSENKKRLDETPSPPMFAQTTAGQAVMQRLIAHWAHPAKRRFPRRRQSYRTLLCVGLENIWKLFHQDSNSKIDTSHWMTINESPDGYAIMHIDGKTGNLSAGNIVAIRNESAQNWQICIIRWASSENNQHFELGIQILATHAITAQLAQTALSASRACLPALILPELPGVQPSPMLVTPASALPPNPKDLVLLIEQHNIEIREIKSAHINEKNGMVDIFYIPTSASETAQAPSAPPPEFR